MRAALRRCLGKLRKLYMASHALGALPVGGFVRRAGTTGCVGRPVKRSRGSMVFRRDVPHAVFAAAWPLAAMRFGTRQKASRSGFPLGEALSFGRQAAVLYALANFCLA